LKLQIIKKVLKVLQTKSKSILIVSLQSLFKVDET